MWKESPHCLPVGQSLRQLFLLLTDFDSGGFVLEADGTWSATWSMGNIADMLTVHFYDWDEHLIGDIVFRK